MPEPEVFLITGTRKGIGRALAEHFLGRGKQVVGCSRTPPAWSHPNFHSHTVDVIDEAGVKAVILAIRKQFGRLDVLINNAGVAAMNHVLLTPLSTARKVFDTNVLGTFLLCREAAKLMQARRYGRIVNLTSVAVRLDLEGEAVYAASKAAVESLTRILARELGPLGITVNAVGPTPVRTDLVAGVPAAKLDALVQRQAIARFGELRDVTHVVDFFVQPESDFVTGQILYLGGV